MNNNSESLEFPISILPNNIEIVFTSLSERIHVDHVKNEISENSNVSNIGCEFKTDKSHYTIHDYILCDDCVVLEFLEIDYKNLIDIHILYKMHQIS